MKIFLFYILFFLSVLAKAQQIGMYSHYFFKPMVFNPAFTGNEGNNAMIINRSQWTDFNGSPQLNIITLEGNLTSNKTGLGLSFISDRKGITNRIGGNLNYSYKLNLNDDTYIRFGISAGIIDQSINYSKAMVENSTDPLLFNDIQRKTSFDVNAGLAFMWKELEFGFAVPQLTANKINYVDNNGVRSYYTQTRHYFGSLKYKFFISEEKGISIIPQLQTRFVPNTPFQYDATIIADWKEKFWLGGTYKNDYAIVVNAGVCLHKQLYIGYAYDIIVGGIGKYSGMSHEIMVNFKFNKKQEKETSPSSDPKLIETINRIDSLTSVLSKSDEKIKMDEEKIKTNENKIKELKDKLDEQSKIQEEMKLSQINSNLNYFTSKNNTTSKNDSLSKIVSQTEMNEQGKVTSEVSKVGIIDVDGIYNAKITDFKKRDGMPCEKGFYIIVGTFFYEDFADAETKRFIANGYKNSNWLFCESKKYHYIYTYKLSTKKEALQKLKEVRSSANIEFAWVLSLVE